MYSYFAAQRGAYQSQKHKRLTRLLLLILIVAVIVLGIMFTNASAFRKAYHASAARLIDLEADAALKELNSLSRTGGSSTASILGKVRQHIYAAQVLVEQDADLTGGRVINSNVFIRLFTTLDTFESKKQAGQPTIEQQTSLTTDLQDLATLLEGEPR